MLTTMLVVWRVRDIGRTTLANAKQSAILWILM
jgi:hypothetical protein